MCCTVYDASSGAHQQSVTAGERQRTGRARPGTDTWARPADTAGKIDRYTIYNFFYYRYIALLSENAVNPFPQFSIFENLRKVV